MALTAKTGMHARRGPKARRTPRATRALAAPGNDGMSAFVAGSTGRLGFRVVRELTKQGVSVRAGARDTERAWRVFKGEEVPSGVGYTGQKDAPTYGELDVSRVEAVQADIFEAKGGLTSAIGDAKTVVSCLGPPETNVGDPSLPRRVDWEGTGRLIEAAEEAGVEHFVLVTSLGTGRFGWPSALLNLFWQILDWKAKAERRLMESSQMEFTIVRPGGMEKPTDDHKETHWARLCEPDTVFGGTISRLQVAEICAAAVRNRDESTNKIYEAIAEEDAPRIPYEEQLEFVPRLPRGCPDRDGLPDVLNRKYRADQRDRWLPLLMDFSPRGPWPEVLNGRCAMAGLAVAAIEEARGKGGIAAQALGQGGVAGIALIAIILIASLPPAVKAVRPEHANAGPFNAKAELWNGRAAAAGFALALALEASNNGEPLTSQSLFKLLF